LTARHVPQRAPAQRPRQRVVDQLDRRPHGLERARVEADLRVGQVAVVEQQQVGLLDADQLGDLRAGTDHVGLHRRTAGQAAVRAAVVEPDGDAVPSQRRGVRTGGLEHRERREPPVLVELEVGAQRVDAAGLQPLLGPAGQVTPRGLLERREQVGELRVPEGVPTEVRAEPGDELALAHPGDELLEGRGPLGVGDPVEADLDRLEVLEVRRDRVRGRQLVLAVGPVLALVGETRPRLVVRRSLHRGVVRGPLGERLVEPQVVPPAHRDQVAEPHVRQLVQHRVGALLVEPPSLLAAREVLVAKRDAPGVLHGPVVELGDVELVVLVERVGVVERVLEELEALLGDGDQLVGVEVRHHRLAAVVAEGHLAVLADVAVEHLVVLTGDDRGHVRRQALGGREAPHGHPAVRRLRPRGRCGGDHLPVRRRGDREGEDRLEVGLLERGEHATGVRHLELRVEVDPVVGRVDEAVQALAGVAVGAVGDHPQLVVGGEVVEPDAGAVVDIGHVEVPAVQRELVHGGADQVGERRGACPAAAEPDDGRGAERLGPLGVEDQVDGVGVDLQELGAGARLVPGQICSRHATHCHIRSWE
jgi:hypothetical protein